MKDLPAERQPKRSLLHFLNMGQASASLLFQILLGRHFGPTSETDAYFVGATILTFLSIVPNFFTDQFLQFYNDIRVSEGSAEARNFYFSVYWLSMLVGGVTALLAYSFRHLIVNGFVIGFSDVSMNIAVDYFAVLLISLLVARVITVNNAFASAEMKFTLPYLVSAFTPVANIISLFTLTQVFGITAIAISTVLSHLVAVVFQQMYLNRHLGTGFKLVLWHHRVPALVKNSFSMRLAQQIYSLRDPLTSNLLSHFPEGTISLYSFAYRLITNLFSITNLPIIQVFHSKISYYVSLRKFTEIPALIRQTTRDSVALFTVCAIPSILVLYWLLGAFFGERFTNDDVTSILLFFIAFIPLHLLMTIESPLSTLVIALKQSAEVAKINVLYLPVLGACAFLSLKLVGIFYFPVAMGIAQVLNLVLYWLYVRRGRWSESAVRNVN